VNNILQSQSRGVDLIISSTENVCRKSTLNKSQSGSFSIDYGGNCLLEYGATLNNVRNYCNPKV
jgi:hypothetical protein